MRYRDAGVDIDRAEAVKDRLIESVRSTWGPNVRPLVGGFAGVMDWPAGGALIAATMDGVGTKLHVALMAGRVADASADLVYHGANDLLVHGARPLAFLDYIAQSRLEPSVVADAVAGLARACRDVGAVLLGGETAEMPDTYLPGVIDVAGCMIGTVAEAQLLDGRRVRAGDLLLGLGADGLHTNGFSLARRVLEQSGCLLGDPLPGGSGTVGEALLAPHRHYGRSVLPLIERGGIRALAHVTGGGIAGNLVRVLPEGLGARIEIGAWTRPPLFRWLIEAGRIPEDDARASFNLGIGLIAVVGPDVAAEVTSALVASGESVHVLGKVETGERRVQWMEP